MAEKEYLNVNSNKTLGKIIVCLSHLILIQNPAEIYQEGYLLFQYVYNGIFHMSRLLNQSEHEQRHQRHAHMGTQLHLRRKLCKFNNAAVLASPFFHQN